MSRQVLIRDVASGRVERCPLDEFRAANAESEEVQDALAELENGKSAVSIGGGASPHVVLALAGAPHAPGYGASSERYRKERELGAKVVEVLNAYAEHRRGLGYSDHPSDPKSHPIYSQVLAAARTLGLLEERAS